MEYLSPFQAQHERLHGRFSPVDGMGVALGAPISTITGRPEATFEEKWEARKRLADILLTPARKMYENIMGGTEKVSAPLTDLGQIARPSLMAQRAMESIPMTAAEIPDLYHGSGAKFTRFADEFIGTGEGVQAFGHGHYLSGLKGVAKTYADPKEAGAKLFIDDNLVQDMWQTIDGPSIDKIAGSNRELGDILGIMRGGGVDSIDDAIFYLKNNKGIDPGNIIHEREIDDAINFLKSGRVRMEFPQKHLYKTTVFKGKDPSEYTLMDWYEPITKEQKNKILSQMETDQVKPWGVGEPLNLNTDQVTTEELYHAVARHYQGQKAASQFFKRAGIDGIRYPVGSLSGMKSDKYNYVIFDPKDITIEKIKSY